tara:strand:+ start:201 stop:731 length:531 start_codon:yes stop_codon:yes gene_type:complete
MSTIEVNKITPISGGTTVTLGNSGDTFNLASGATAGFGKIGQVVQTTKTDLFSTTSTSYVDVTGVSASITPSATSSKIYVILNGHSNSSQASVQIYRLKLLRDSTSIGIPSGQIFESYGVSNAPQTFSTFLLDEPSTTSSVTYKLQCLVSGDTCYIGSFGPAVEAPTTLTLMEVLA